MRTMTKHETATDITYTIPAQDTLLGSNVVVLKKTTDGSLSVNYTVDASFGSVSWQQFATDLEAGYTVQVV